MRKYLKKIVLVSIVVAVFSFFKGTCVTVNGEENTSEGVGFVYKNVRPKNSLSQGNYFDLLVKPDEKQTLITEITNQMDEDITINIALNDAKTTDSGLIEYGPSKLKNEKGLKIKIADVVDIPRRVVIKKGEVKKIETKIHLPKEKFSGIILGGVQLQREKKKTEAKEEQQKNTVIENEYAYVFSLSLREEKAPVKMELGSYNNGIKKDATKKQPYIGFSNESASIVKNMTVEMTLMHQDSDEVVSEKKIKKMKMAPHSMIEVPFDINNLDEGTYRTNTKVMIGDKVWKWKDVLSVGKKQEKSRNMQAQSQKEEKRWGIIGLIVAVFCIMVFIIYSVLKKI